MGQEAGTATPSPAVAEAVSCQKDSVTPLNVPSDDHSYWSHCWAGRLVAEYVPQSWVWPPPE